MIPLPFAGKVLLYGGLALGILALLFGLYRSVYNSGYRAGEQLLKDYINEQGEATREVEKIVEKIVVQTEVKYVDRIKVVKQKAEVIETRIPFFITKSDDRACELRSGSVRLHDSAASGAGDPGTTAESDRDPAGIELSEAMRTVAKNYALYYACREQVIGWNELWTTYTASVKTSGCVPR